MSSMNKNKKKNSEMSIYGTLEFSLREILLTIKPLEDDWVTRFHIINEFQAVVESVESLKGATVEPFGSFLSNLYTRWGVWISLWNYLRGHMSCLLGKTTCIPAILPPLKEIYSGNIADNLTGVRDTVERDFEETCAANITRFRSNRFRTVNQSSLSELFIAFFEKFSEIGSKPSLKAICTYTGQWENIKSNMRWMPKPLFIEDPFELTENAARAVCMDQVVRIAEAFEMTYCRLLSAIHNQDYLIETLVRPEVRTQIVRRTLKGVPSTSGGHLRSRSQLRNAVPSTIQSHFQNLRLETRPSSSQKSRKAVHGRGQ